jgi:O-antigen/teichoic acid export membrane protein
MNPAGNAVSVARLMRRAFSLGAVKAFDHAVQLLLPIVLVRCLDTATFGEYRLLWLAVGTIMTFATLNMGASLYYFVPRSEPRRKRLYVHQTMLYLAAAGLVCGFMVSPWNALLPAPMHPLAQYGWVVPTFVALWVLAFLLDHLPSVDECISWQVYALLTVSTLRVSLVALGAWLTGDLRVMLWLLLVVVVVKLALLVYYVWRRHGLGRPWFDRAAFAEQFRYAAPIGASNVLNGLRGQADQWIAASLFALSSFAAFSIAAHVGQLMIILRSAVVEAFLPSMSRTQANGDVAGMLRMMSQGNLIVARLLYPALAFVFVFTEEIVTLVYTASYLDAVPVIRTYIVGVLPLAIETTSIVLLLRRGAFALRLTAFTLVLSVALSWTAALHIGLAGAAAGSAVAVYVDRALLLRHLSRHTGIAFRRLQDWRALLTALAFAAATAALAWVVVARALADSGALLRIAAGAAVFMLAYAALHLSAIRTLGRKERKAQNT